MDHTHTHTHSHTHTHTHSHVHVCMCVYTIILDKRTLQYSGIFIHNACNNYTVSDEKAFPNMDFHIMQAFTHSHVKLIIMYTRSHLLTHTHTHAHTLSLTHTHSHTRTYTHSKGTTNVTDLKTDLSAFDIEDGVNVESELDLEIATIGLDGMGMESEDGELGIECETSQDGLNQVASSTLCSDDAFNIREDFDDLLQYGISTTGRTASFNSSSPQIYHDHTTLKRDCLQTRHVEASQLQFASKNFSKNVHRLGLGGEESQRRSIVEGLSHSVGPDFTTTASRPNQHHLGQGEALCVLAGGRVSGGDRSGGPSLLELVEDTQAAVQTEIQDNAEEHDVVDIVRVAGKKKKKMEELLIWIAL